MKRFLCVLLTLFISQASAQTPEQRVQERHKAARDRAVRCSACISEKADMERKCSGKVPAFRNREERCPVLFADWHTRCDHIVPTCPNYEYLPGIFR